MSHFNTKYLVALGEKSPHFGSESVKAWSKGGIEIVFTQNDRALINLCQQMTFKVAFLESNFCPNSIRLLDWGVRNTTAAWVYSIRGEFLQSLSQLALQKGAKCVLHEPKQVDLLLLRLGIEHNRSKDSSYSSDPLFEKLNIAIAELKETGKHLFKKENLNPSHFERRHSEWETFIKSANTESEQSFTGFDSYQRKYSRLLRNMSATMEDTEISFVTLRPKSIIDKNDNGVRVLISSHEKNIQNSTQANLLENTKLPEVMHTVRSQEVVILKKDIKDSNGKVNGQEYSAAIPMRDSNDRISGVLLARKNAENIESHKFIRNTYDLSSFSPKLQRPFQSLEYFSRIYNGLAA